MKEKAKKCLDGISPEKLPVSSKTKNILASNLDNTVCNKPDSKQGIFLTDTYPI